MFRSNRHFPTEGGSIEPNSILAQVASSVPQMSIFPHVVTSPLPLPAPFRISQGRRYLFICATHGEEGAGRRMLAVCRVIVCVTLNWNVSSAGCSNPITGLVELPRAAPLILRLYINCHSFSICFWPSSPSGKAILEATEREKPGSLLVVGLDR